MKNNTNISGFSIIEVLVGIFIFTLGLISIYMIMVSSLQLNDYNKNQIIASNLAREQIELVRNVRDSNYNTLHAWNWLPNGGDDSDPKLTIGSFYKIENNWDATDYPISIDPILGMDDSWVEESEVRIGGKMENFQLCLDSSNRYIFCPGSEKTPFYRYVKIEDISIANAEGVANAVKVISKVVWYKRGYHELEINTILADWKRL